MNDVNIKNLQNLSKVCHRSGILPIFLGVLVLFVGTVDGLDVERMASGLLIFIMGYAFVKIADKIKKNIA